MGTSSIIDAGMDFYGVDISGYLNDSLYVDIANKTGNPIYLL